MRWSGVIAFVVSFGLSVNSVRAQGTFTFANIGGGVVAPISDHDGHPLNSQYTVELAVQETGIRITKPTHFLANGLFADGVKSIPGVLPGETIGVWLLIGDGGITAGRRDIVGITKPFNIVLGGQGIPPSLPGNLKEFDGILIDPRRRYQWDFGGCLDVAGPSLALNWVDSSLCVAEDERVGKVRDWLNITAPSLLFSRDSEGELELRWLAGSSLVLYGSPTANKSDARVVLGIGYDKGYLVYAAAFEDSQMFYWLSKPDEAGD